MQFQFHVVIGDFHILPNEAHKNIPVEFQLVPGSLSCWQLGILLQVAEICIAETCGRIYLLISGNHCCFDKKSNCLHAFWALRFQAGWSKSLHQGKSHLIQMQGIHSILEAQLASLLLREHTFSQSLKKRQASIGNS